MNFLALKTMVEWLVKQHTCPSCGAHISVWNVDIIWAAGSNINLDLTCQECGNHSMIKSEIMSVKMSPDQLKTFWSTLKNIQNKKQITDDQIIQLHKDLNNKTNISDLFNDK